MNTAVEWNEITADEVKSLIVKKLNALGFKDENPDLISYETERVAENIKNIIHQPFVPAGLKYVLTDRVCGAVLDAVYNTDTSGEMETPITGISLGDTNISWSGSQSIANIISDLKKSGEKELLRYRKLCF